MKKNKLTLILICVFAVVVGLTGCKKKQPEQPQVVEQPAEQPEESTAGKSTTTGRAKEKNGVPIMVSIPNDTSARPHVGISKADVVYEMYVEGSITRMLALFHDEMPAKVGPVRSARFYMVDIQDDWRSALVHYGGPRASNEWSLYNKIKTSRIKYRLDGTQNGSHFSRDNNRKAPNNAFVDLAAYSATIDSAPPVYQPMKFSENPTVGNSDIKEIAIEYSGSNKIKYVYDQGKNSYARFVNGNEYVDGDGGAQVYFENIIVQHTKQTNYGDVKGHINLDMMGSGKATFHIGGKMIEGTWERADRSNPTVYKDANGNEIKLGAGHTIVQIVTDTVPVTNS